jgi:hypothetical protein
MGREARMTRDGRLSGRLRPAAPPGGGAPGHLARAAVAKIRSLGAASSIRIGDPQAGAFPFLDFLTTIVTNEHGLASQRSSSVKRCERTILTKKGRDYSAVIRAPRNAFAALAFRESSLSAISAFAPEWATMA